MRDTRRWWRTAASVAVLALALSACGGGGDGDTGASESETASTGGSESSSPAASESGSGQAAEVKTGAGVTSEPCPDAVNQDNGCIYVGTLSDLSDGPFATFGPQLVAGQEAFWKRVNEQGGIGGAYNVSMQGYTEDTHYKPDLHAQAYQKIHNDVAALTQTLGTPPTLAILDTMKSDNMVGAVSTWWSGWAFEPNILQTGTSYCLATMDGIEWEQKTNDIKSVMVVYYPGDYGGDSLAGAKVAVDKLGLEMMGEIQQVPTAAGGDVSGAVQQIVQKKPDLVVLTVGPVETGQIIGQAAAGGYQGQFLGNNPTFDKALLDSAAGPALEAMFNITAPHENWGGDAPAFQAMKEAFGDGQPQNDGWTYGWMITYPIKSALEQAYKNGDLTHEGIYKASQEMTVDYEGALPDINYGADPNEAVVRQSTIGKPDKNATDRLGIQTVEKAFTGDVAKNFDFTEPCAAAG